MNDRTAFGWPAGLLWQRRFLVVGIASLILCGAGAIFDRQQFLRSYLFAYFSWLGLALGSLGLWMLHNLTGGAWGIALRRIWETIGRSLPILALLFVPIAIGVRSIYPWVSAEEGELGSKAEFLNVPFFLVRAAFYFAVWLTLATLLNRWSNAHEQTQERVYVDQAERLSGPGLVLMALTVSFAALDWIMSLEPDWYSTIFGALVGAGFLLAALALAIGIATLTNRAGSNDTWNDLGTLLFAFVMLWTYMAFSQFLLIWSGNLPEEITWYLHRTEGGWQWIGLALAVGYFALPFCFLLSRAVKRNPDRLRMVAFLIVGMNALHNLWLIAPAFSPGRLQLHWMDLAAWVGIGAVWLHQLLRRLDPRPVLPVPTLPVEEALHA